jgi:glycosyltransferase involved in cell wall biosynthesis
MKIALVVPNYWPDMIGGAEWYVYHITHELALIGNEIHVFTQQTKKAKTLEETINQVFVHRLPSFGFFYRIKIWKGLISSLKKHALDAIIALDYAQPHSWQAMNYGKKNKIPVFLMINDVQTHKTGRNFLKQRALEIFDKYFAPKVLSKANKILVRTSWTKSWVKKKGIDDFKIEITPSGLTKEELTQGDAAAFGNKYKINDDIILYLGRIRKQKGVFLLLDAYKEVKTKISSAKLVYVGPDEKEYDGLEFTPKLREKVQKEKIKDVYFLGPLYGEDKINALSACNVLCVPSSFENFGQVYSQAFAQKKPVIGTTGGGIPDIINHNVDGYTIEPWNKKQLVFYLIKLLSDKNLQIKMGKAGFQKIQKYLYSKLANELENIL